MIKKKAGEFLFETYIEGKALSIRSFSEQVGLSHANVLRIIKGKTKITPKTALKIAKATPGMTAQTWVHRVAAEELEAEKSRQIQAATPQD